MWCSHYAASNFSRWDMGSGRDVTIILIIFMNIKIWVTGSPKCWTLLEFLSECFNIVNFAFSVFCVPFWNSTFFVTISRMGGFRACVNRCLMFTHVCTHAVNTPVLRTCTRQPVLVAGDRNDSISTCRTLASKWKRARRVCLRSWAGGHSHQQTNINNTPSPVNIR